ncbi:MAG: hypothetical protein RLZZ352_5 [Pseudomonadota bacterium]|jgi:energy-coupling factor transporter ATP-binding protein EcfA2
MKLQDIPFLSREVLQAQVDATRPFNPTAWQAGEVVVRAKDSALLLRQGDQLVNLANPTDAAGPLSYQAQNPLALWWMSQPKSRTVWLRYLLPQEVLRDWAGQITVDTRTADALKQSRHIQEATPSAAIAWLKDEFLLEAWPPASPESPSVMRALCAIHNRRTPDQLQWFGRKHTLDIRRDKAGVLWVERVASRKHDPDQAFTLIEGNIDFVDVALGLEPTQAESFQAAQTAASTFGSYLELWQLYGTKEWQRALKQAADIEAFHYTKASPLSDEGGGWRLHGDQQTATEWWKRWQALVGADEQVEISEDAPDWQADHYQDPAAEAPRNPLRGDISWDRQRNELILETNSREHPPASGYVCLSLAGHRTQHKRRIKARQLIESGHGVPALKALLQDSPTPTQRPSTLKALTPYARASFHQGKPTDRQADALHIALNTPDIALIIGPPGTGKTQVIAALERRLSEDSQGQMLAQQVLISSYQHDAVENALERTDVYGLPAIKIGASRRREGSDPVLNWCSRQLESVIVQRDEAIAKTPGHTLLVELDTLLTTLQVMGALPEERPAKLDRLEALLKQLAEQQRLRAPSAWWGAWEEARLRQAASSPPQGHLTEHQRLRYRRQVRALRVLPLSFADDGPQQATRLLASLDHLLGLLTSQDQALLQQARTAEAACSNELLNQLAALQTQLLDRLRRDECSTVQRSRLPNEMLALLKQLQDGLIDKLSTSRLNRATVLTRYAQALEDQPDRIRATVERYSSVVGATCQQAASRQMALLKEGSEDVLSGLQFDSVVIDEAARANPLDLFVPMALAGRRIILVGDPRQLPHLLDEEIEEEIRAERGAQVDSDLYKKSLFERLVRQLEKRRVTDGFSRVVMLDTQFRMHPRLGDFVSHWFYERPGLGKVKSGRPETDFAPTVPGFGVVVCAWINVPAEQGEEERHSKSRRRLAEAKRMAHEVDRLLKSLPPNTSVGIITFYAAQRDAIFEALARFNLTERGETGWRVCSEFASTPSGAERLRIGTVDAFQGKEFDVVLLSTVRCNRKPVNVADDAGLGDEAFERQASARYGHLRSANRLNVAMSRQRRLLVGVGDETMFQGPEAQRCVPEMQAFLQLCDEEARRG